MRRILLYIMCSVLAFGAMGQDIHFSQYNASPLNLNPALTGFFNGDYRAVANFRSQWGSFTVPYRTVSGSFEVSALKGKLDDGYMGFGLQFYNDRAGDAGFKTNYVLLSYAYKKTLGGKVKHGLGIGFQVAYIGQGLDTDELRFDSQYNGVIVDPSINSGEAVNGSGGNVDANVGLLWQIVPGDFFNIYFGAAYSHFLQPEIKLLNTVSYQLQPKYTAHMGAKIDVSNLVNLLPSAVYWQQAGARQMNAGTYVQFVLEDFYDNHTAFSLGAWARVADPTFDAVIFGGRLDFLGATVALTYDLNVSRLNEVSQSRGAYEVSLIYTGEFITKGKRQKEIPCPQL